LAKRHYTGDESEDLSMAKPYLGQLSAFQFKEETISAYLERTHIFFQANEITEDKRKVTVFLNAIGAKMYTLLRDLLSPVCDL